MDMQPLSHMEGWAHVWSSVPRGGMCTHTCPLSHGEGRVYTVPCPTWRGVCTHVSFVPYGGACTHTCPLSHVECTHSYPLSHVEGCVHMHVLCSMWRGVYTHMSSVHVEGRVHTCPLCVWRGMYTRVSSVPCGGAGICMSSERLSRTRVSSGRLSQARGLWGPLGLLRPFLLTVAAILFRASFTSSWAGVSPCCTRACVRTARTSWRRSPSCTSCTSSPSAAGCTHTPSQVSPPQLKGPREPWVSFLFSVMVS